MVFGYEYASKTASSKRSGWKAGVLTIAACLVLASLSYDAPTRSNTPFGQAVAFFWEHAVSAVQQKLFPVTQEQACERFASELSHSSAKVAAGRTGSDLLSCTTWCTQFAGATGLTSCLDSCFAHPEVASYYDHLRAVARASKQLEK